MEAHEFQSLLEKVSLVLESNLEPVDRSGLEDIRDSLVNGAIPDVDSLGFLIAVHDALG